MSDKVLLRLRRAWETRRGWPSKLSRQSYRDARSAARLTRTELGRYRARSAVTCRKERLTNLHFARRKGDRVRLKASVEHGESWRTNRTAIAAETTPRGRHIADHATSRWAAIPTDSSRRKQCSVGERTLARRTSGFCGSCWNSLRVHVRVSQSNRSAPNAVSHVHTVAPPGGPSSLICTPAIRFSRPI